MEGLDAPPPVEPNAELRNAAHGIRELYVSLMYAGFTQAEALHIVVQILQQLVVATYMRGDGES